MTLADEFATIYVYNLRGNMRKPNWREEGGQIFGAGSQTTVVVTFLVKRPDRIGTATIHYRDIGNYLNRQQKLDIVAHDDLALIDWQTVTPNTSGDWINQRGVVFETYPPIGAKGDPSSVFHLHSGGLKTNRDAWVYSSSRPTLADNVRRMIETFNNEAQRLRSTPDTAPLSDPTRISWSSHLLPLARAGAQLEFETDAVRLAAYRPFDRAVAYFSASLNDRRGQLPRMFPTPEHQNLGIYQVGAGSAVPFSVLALDALPDLHVTGAGSGGQFFPRWTWEAVADDAAPQGAFDLSGTSDDVVVVAGYRRVDNINPATVADHRAAYGSAVTSDDVFHYVYGLLHSPDYREAFAADLTRMLPRIPKVPDAEHFRAFVDAGRRLADLHIGYESVDPYPLSVTGDQPAGPAKDRSTIVYNPRITVSGIPDEAHEYLLGSRSAIEWVVERYQVKTDKASGIVNDPNYWSREVGDPRYILDLIARVVTVSVETVQIVRSLPSIDLEALS